jgi:hypothetical protein
MGRQPRKAVRASPHCKMQFTPWGEAKRQRSTWQFLQVWRPFLFMHSQNFARAALVLREIATTNGLRSGGKSADVFTIGA